MRKNYIFILSIILLTLFFHSCQYKDINRRLFIAEIGIDEIENSELIELTVKAAIPSSVGGGELEVKQQLYTVKANSLGNALRMLKSQTSLEPEYAQMKTIVVGRDYAENNSLEDLIDFCIRRRDIQNIAYFMIGDPSAKAIVNNKAIDSNIPGSETFMKFGQGSESPYSQGTRIYKMYKSMKNPGETPYCPMATINGEVITINKIAVLSAATHKMVNELSPEDTLTFKLLTNSAKNPYLSAITEDNRIFGANLNKINTKFKFISKSKDEIHCKITIKASATVEQVTEELGDTKKLSALFSEELSNRVSTFIASLQEKRIDPLHFEIKYWAVTPTFELIEEWNEEIFPKITFEVESKIQIIGSGTLQ